MGEGKREQLKTDEEQPLAEIAEKRIEINVRQFRLEIVGGRRKRVSIHGKMYWKYYDFQLICRDGEKTIFSLSDLDALLCDQEDNAWGYFIQEQSHDRIYGSLPVTNERLDVYFKILEQVEKALTVNYSPRGYKRV